MKTEHTNTWRGVVAVLSEIDEILDKNQNSTLSFQYMNYLGRIIVGDYLTRRDIDWFFGFSIYEDVEDTIPLTIDSIKKIQIGSISTKETRLFGNLKTLHDNMGVIVRMFCVNNDFVDNIPNNINCKNIYDHLYDGEIVSFIKNKNCYDCFPYINKSIFERFANMGLLSEIKNINRFKAYVNFTPILIDIFK